MKLILSVDSSSSSSSSSEEGDSPVPKEVKKEVKNIIKNINTLENILAKELLNINNKFADFELIEISLSFVTPEKIHEINSAYRDCNEATDVLSFPVWEFNGELDISGAPLNVPLELGDIVICPDETFKIHNDLNKTEALCLMIAHSFLHLLAWDHDTEERQKIMFQRQGEIKNNILSVINLENNK